MYKVHKVGCVWVDDYQFERLFRMKICYSFVLHKPKIIFLTTYICKGKTKANNQNKTKKPNIKSGQS